VIAQVICRCRGGAEVQRCRGVTEVLSGGCRGSAEMRCRAGDSAVLLVGAEVMQRFSRVGAGADVEHRNKN